MVEEVSFKKDKKQLLVVSPNLLHVYILHELSNIEQVSFGIMNEKYYEHFKNI